MRHTATSRLVPLLIAAGGAVFLAGCGKKEAPHGGFPPAKVAVITVHPEVVPLTQEYIGRGVSPYDVELRALVSGRLKESPMVDGAEVKAGDLLFSLDDVPFKAALENSLAQIAQSQAATTNAQKTLDRMKSVSDARAVSDKDLDDAINALTFAKAGLAAAKAAYEKSKWDLDNTRIIAPVSGRLGKAAVVPGAPIAANQTFLVRLQQTDPIWVNFSIPENTLLKFTSEVRSGKITHGAEADFKVTLKLSDGSVYPIPGKLNFADINLRTEISAMEARAIVANPDHRLKPGQFFTVSLTGPERRDVFLVPQRAIQIDPTSKHVFVVAKLKDKEGKEYEGVQAREVVTGEWYGNRWAVESGLQDGDRVIVEGLQGVGMRGGPGAAVVPEEYKVEAKPAATEPAAK
jgi:membrane fusion protein (multidrug efflux system)